MDQRVKGQETEVLLVLDGKVQNTITTIKSFEIAFQLEILKEGYLGETTDRRDEIFRGVRGKLELHINNQDIFDLVQSVVDRAQRRTSGVKVNVKSTINFPNGQRPRIIIPDVSFGEVPLNFAGRSDYGTVSLDWEASNFARIN